MAALLMCESSAFAQSTVADRETARSLMAQGRAARERGDLAGALKAFAGADDLMHVPTTGLELARADEALGHLLEAREVALRVIRLPEKATDPAPFKAARETARWLADELESRIPSLIVTTTSVPEGSRASVTIDGAALELPGQPRKLDPGHHVVVARAGAALATREVDLAEKESKRIALDLGAAGVGAAQAPDAPQDRPRGQGSVGGHILLYSGIALVAAGVVTGAVTGVVSMTKTNQIKDSGSCNGDVCNPSEHDDIETAKWTATVSTVSFAAAGAGAVFAVIGLLLQSPSSSAEENATRARGIEPWVGIGAAGLRGRF